MSNQLQRLLFLIGRYSITGEEEIKKEMDGIVSELEIEHEIVENLKKLEYHVKKDGNEMYGIYCYNITGGCEFSTHYGYADKEHSIREFQSVFHFDVWDYETKKTYKYGELQSQHSLSNVRGKI